MSGSFNFVCPTPREAATGWRLCQRPPVLRGFPQKLSAEQWSHEARFHLFYPTTPLAGQRDWRFAIVPSHVFDVLLRRASVQQGAATKPRASTSSAITTYLLSEERYEMREYERAWIALLNAMEKPSSASPRLVNLLREESV